MKKNHLDVAIQTKENTKTTQLNVQNKKINKPTSPDAGRTTEFTRQLASEIVRNLSAFGKITFRPFVRSSKESTKPKIEQYNHPILLDTSVLIDGRIVPLIKSGLVNGTIVISDIVLQELRHIADSNDQIRRAKGRRGLEAVQLLQKQKNASYSVKISKDISIKKEEVDDKLISFAQVTHALFITYDFNLAQVARAKGIKVLNLNELLLALRLTVIPGEEMAILITHEGKEKNQGVGYLSDGTMVVVDEAKMLVGHNCQCVVTKIHQTPAGQILFARIR
jgi:uncharacterized protein YacL